MNAQGSVPRPAAARLHADYVAIALATCAAGLLGIFIGTATHPEKAAAPPPPATTLHVAAATLTLAPEWALAPGQPPFPGLEQGRSLRANTSDVTLAVLPAETDRLLPASLATGEYVPARRRVSAGSVHMWAYDAASSDGATATVIAAPSTAGIVTVGCLSPLAAAGADCRSAAARISLQAGEAWLDPAPDTALRLGLPSIVAALDRTRRTAREQLAATRDPRARRAAAAVLAAAYARAGRATRPLAAPAFAALPRVLGELAADHTALGAASAARDPRGARRAGQRIDRGERRLQRLLGRLGA